MQRMPEGGLEESVDRCAKDKEKIESDLEKQRWETALMSVDIQRRQG